MQTLKLLNSIGAVYEATRKALFIIAASLIVLVAIRNSITWHMEQFWGASKAFFSEKWAYIYQLSGENDFIMYVLGTQVFGFIVFFIANSFFMFLDLTGRPQCLHKYKIQDDKNIPVSWEKYKKSLKVILFNITVVSMIFQLVTWPLASWRRLRCDYELPSFPQVVFHLLFFIMIEEIGFYYLHRLFHHRYLYSRIHKIHHEWTAPVSIVSIYCHPLEHFFVNLLPILGGSLLLGDYFGNHLASLWLFLMAAIINTTCTHCGYHLPFLASPEAHDFHHSKFIYNFGAIGILDHLHGTDGVFRHTKSYERHFILTGLSSAKQLVPDSQKKHDKS